MKKALAVVVTALFLVVCAGAAFAAQKAPQKVVDLANSKLMKLGTDPVIVKAVNAENSKGKTVDQIKEMDKKWMATPGVADYMKALMENDCAKRLKDIQKSASYYEEIFVMDNQGANVCMTNKTSDYWQGDEDKFTKSYNKGAGATHIPDVKFDDSSQSYIVQVSVPVKDGDKVIGAITFGINPDKMK